MGLVALHAKRCDSAIYPDAAGQPVAPGVSAHERMAPVR